MTGGVVGHVKGVGPPQRAIAIGLVADDEDRRGIERGPISPPLVSSTDPTSPPCFLWISLLTLLDPFEILGLLLSLFVWILEELWMPERMIRKKLTWGLDGG